MADKIGQQIGNYRIVSPIGRGGFADVYLAEHVYLKTHVAMKILHTPVVSPPEMESFLKEAQIIAHLQHPHITRVKDFGLHEGKIPYLIMDYAPNGSLRKLHRKGTLLPLPLVISYVKQTADALQYAHDEKFVHRDVKPENMLLGRHNEVLLSDFGIAIVAQSSRHQSTQDIVGTVAYMSPEQIHGKPRPASDQYSLGIVVYEWLGGDRPFHGSFAELCTQHLFAQPPSLREKLPTISPDVEMVVMKALAKDPKDRYPRIADFAEELEKASILTQQVPLRVEPTSSNPVPPSVGQTVLTPTPVRPTQAEKPPQPVPTPTVNPRQSATKATPSSSASKVENLLLSVAANRRVSRRKLVTIVGTGVTIGASAGGIYWIAHLRNSNVQSLQTIGRTPASSTTPGTTLYTYHGHSEFVFAVAWSLDGKYIASGSGDKTVQVWEALTGSKVLTYQGHNDLVLAVAWSPDGKYIASGSLNDSLQVWEALSGTKVLTYQGHSNLGAVAEVRLAWSPGSKYIASALDDKAVQVWEALSGKTVLTYHGHSNYVFAVAWSLDGKYIASGSGDKTVQVWEALTGSKVLTYQGHNDLVLAVAWSPDGKYIASGSVDRIVQVWEALSGKLVSIYQGHADVVAWSPDSKYIASASYDAKSSVYDKIVEVWEALSGKTVLTYHGHNDIVTAVAWSPTSKYIASASDDQTVRVWEAP